MNGSPKSSEILIPHLETSFVGPLHQIERHLLDHQITIETWFRRKWQQVPIPFYSSVDLRNAGFKLAPVDTNLFPAGFNNLSPETMPLCVQAVRSEMEKIAPKTTQILLIPESHTHHMFYFEHLASLKEILNNAGFVVRIGSLLEQLKTPKQISLSSGKSLLIEPLIRKNHRIWIGDDFSPCLILLNNDLSDGVPKLLEDIEQHITPAPSLGWATRVKSEHFKQYQTIVEKFCHEISLDPWLISPLFRNCGEVDFMTGEGQECLIKHADALFESIKQKYVEHNIKLDPFVVIKADAGTYGMAVLMIKSSDALKHLNRKERQNMSTSKGKQKVSKVILQEGVYSFETWGPQESVAEPVVYMIGSHIVGGFYRVHAGKSIDENLNAPGMNFEPLAFAESCSHPCSTTGTCDNRFYAYGVVARLALLAAGMEVK